MDTVLAIFLAAALSAGDAQQPAAEPTENCEYYVSGAAQQGLLVCERRADGDARASLIAAKSADRVWVGSNSPDVLLSRDAAGR